MLRIAAREDGQAGFREDRLVTLEPGTQGAYHVPVAVVDDSASTGTDGSGGEDRSSEPDDHRVAVFLDAHVLSDAR